MENPSHFIKRAAFPYISPLKFVIYGSIINTLTYLTKITSAFDILLISIFAAVLELFFHKQKKVPSNILSITFALVLYIFMRQFIVDTKIMSSTSMEPAITKNSKVVVQKSFYQLQRGDLIIYKHPEKHALVVHRLIGLPGETLEIKEGKVYINGSLITNTEVPQGLYYKNAGEYGKVGQELKIPTNNYYLLGDNSDASCDSRYWGFVPKGNIKGKVVSIKPPPQK